MDELVKNEKNIAGQILNPSDLVSYQSNSIVSREVVRKAGGTVTVFAFDQDQALSEHTSPYGAVISILEGEAIITISGKSNHLKEGQMIILPADEVHSLKASKRFKMILIMIKS